MPLDALAAPLAADPCFPGETARPAIRAITAAEVVFHEDEVDAEILAHVPRSVLVEPIAADAVAKDLGIDRARKLAAEGWRNPLCGWSPATPAPPAADFAEAGIVRKRRRVQRPRGRGSLSSPALTSRTFWQPL